jgi:hypothetical protein
VLVYVKVLPQHLSGGCEENYEKMVRITGLWCDLNLWYLDMKQGCQPIDMLFVIAELKQQL